MSKQTENRVIATFIILTACFEVMTLGNLPLALLLASGLTLIVIFMVGTGDN